MQNIIKKNYLIFFEQDFLGFDFGRGNFDSFNNLIGKTFNSLFLEIKN